MRIPHTCPVCAGRGQLPRGFYEDSPSAICGAVACRTCSGAGIVWDPLGTPVVAPWGPVVPGVPPLPYIGDPPPYPTWPGGAGSPGPFPHPFMTWCDVSSPDAAGVAVRN